MVSFDLNACWFAGAVVMMCGTALVGVVIGLRSDGAARAAAAAAVAWMLGWAWLIHHPAVALEVLPLEMLSRVEGFGGVPGFMLILGIAWARSPLNRQRMVVAWAGVFGVVYFINGGLWLLQSTPSAVMGHTSGETYVLQSQDYSCVPAATATALNILGLPTSEAEMAAATDTRPGTGATVIRALRGLETRLNGTDLYPRLLEVDLIALRGMPLPMLTPLQFEPDRRHMVVIVSLRSNGVWLMDPMMGLASYDWATFGEHFRGQVIAFEGRRDPAPQ